VNFRFPADESAAAAEPAAAAEAEPAVQPAAEPAAPGLVDADGGGASSEAPTAGVAVAHEAAAQPSLVGLDRSESTDPLFDALSNNLSQPVRQSMEDGSKSKSRLFKKSGQDRSEKAEKARAKRADERAKKEGAKQQAKQEQTKREEALLAREEELGTHWDRQPAMSGGVISLQASLLYIMRLNLLGPLSRQDYRFPVKLSKSGPDKCKRIVLYMDGPE
jgi:hypothetical protein